MFNLTVRPGDNVVFNCKVGRRAVKRERGKKRKSAKKYLKIRKLPFKPLWYKIEP